MPERYSTLFDEDPSLEDLRAALATISSGILEITDTPIAEELAEKLRASSEISRLVESGHLSGPLEFDPMSTVTQSVQLVERDTEIVLQVTDELTDEWEDAEFTAYTRNTARGYVDDGQIVPIGITHEVKSAPLVGRGQRYEIEDGTVISTDIWIS
jgi:hypothetical protein